MMIHRATLKASPKGSHLKGSGNGCFTGVIAQPPRLPLGERGYLFGMFLNDLITNFT